MGDSPGGNVCGSVQQILDQPQVLLLALNTGTKPSSTGLLGTMAKIIGALQPFLARVEDATLCGSRLYRQRQTQDEQLGVNAFGDKNAGRLVCCFAAHGVVVSS